MKKILLCSLFFCSIISPFSSAYATDSCKTIEGNWHGHWHAFDNRCDARGQATRDGENVYFNFTVYNCPLAQSFSMSGRCHHNQLLLANSNAVMHGSVWPHHFWIKGDGQRARLDR